MDLIQDYQDYLLTASRRLIPYLWPFISSLNSIRDTLIRTIYPILLPFLNRLAILAQDSPAIVSVAVLLGTLFITMRILNYAQRIILWWTGILFTLLFWGGLVVLGMVVWQRGIGRTATELAGYAKEIGEVWWREYRRWEGYQNQASKGDKGVGYGSGSARTGWR